MPPFDAKLYQATLEASRQLIDAGSPDGSVMRLAAHGHLLRAASFGAGIGDSKKLEYIAGALADIGLAVNAETTARERMMAMADIFDARSEALERESNNDANLPVTQAIARTKAIAWQEASNLLRQVAAV